MTMFESFLEFSKKYPEHKVIGYWEKDGEYIFATEASLESSLRRDYTLFHVTKDHKVYGTTPIVEHLKMTDFHKI